LQKEVSFCLLSIGWESNLSDRGSRKTMIPSQKSRVLIADDHALVAEGLVGLLASEYDIVGVSENGRRLLVDALALRPDLIVLDVSMPGLNGIEAAKLLRKSLPSAKLIFVTQQMDPHYLRAAFREGATAYVAKQSASEELRAALKEAVSGGTYISRLLQEKVAFAPVSELRRDSAGVKSDLTSRQREVLQLIAEGKTSREIAAALKISPKTVEFHKRALMDQIGLRTTAELTRYAVANGIVSL
jgi:DNA-binding NarL/FixJ family response regulator